MIERHRGASGRGTIDPAADDRRPYASLVRQVEELFVRHGDTHRGLGYPKPDHFRDRYRIYLDVMRFGPPAPAPARILDIGCATGCVLDEIKASGRGNIVYRGIDLSESMIKVARSKHPEANFILGDPLEYDDAWSPPPDYVLMGGIFTWRAEVARADMMAYMLRLLRVAFEHCRVGLAFNVMSHHVDWQRDDLLHVPFDEMAALIHANLSRNYVFRAEYGLYEYTTYVYR
jgi:SAM-dependent methyltransferase